MAVPGWPETYGYNLFLYPLSTWFWGPWDLFIEHGHRLLGALAGMIAIAVAISCWTTRVSTLSRWVSVAALVGVIVQGCLGGLRVWLDSRTVAQIHGCMGPCYLALVGVLVLVTSRAWQQGNLSPLTHDTSSPARSLSEKHIQMCRELAAFLTAFSFLQLVLGSFLRHQPLGMSWRDFQLATIFHVFTAVALTALVIRTAILTSRGSVNALSRRLSWLLTMAVLGQFLLGCSTWLVNYGWPFEAAGSAWFAGWTITAEGMTQSLVTTAHQAIGAAFLAGSVSLYVSTWAGAFAKSSCTSEAPIAALAAFAVASPIAAAGRVS